MHADRHANVMRSLYIALIVAVGIRIAVVAGTAVWPVPNENGFPVSIFHIATSLDMWIMNKARLDYSLVGAHDHSLALTIESFKNFYIDPGVDTAVFYPPPLFPLLLEAVDYKWDNTVLIGMLFLSLGILMAAAWLRWLAARQVPLVWLVAFALLPHPIWHMIHIGTDLLGAVFFAGFFLSYFGLQRSRQRILVSLFFLIMLLLTRPTGVSVAIFLLVDLLFLERNLDLRHRLLVCLGVCVLCIPFAVFYTPIFVSVAITETHYTFLDIPVADYYAGIFEFMPRWLDLGLSWLSLIGVKVLYLVGLRPSWGDAGIEMLIIRSAPGLIFLPGLFWMFIKAPRRELLLVVLVLLPVMVGAAQDRYTLPIQPFLLFYGYLAYRSLWNILVQRSASEPVT